MMPLSVDFILRAEFVVNTNVYLHFISYFHYDMALVGEILMEDKGQFILHSRE